MMKKNGLFTGSFDPITKGHVDLIERASQLFDQLYVGIFYNKAKQGFFPVEERLEMVEASLAHLKNVTVITSSDQLAVSVAEELGATHLVRGLRNGADLAYEMSMEFYNQALSQKLDTIYLTSKLAHREISSSGIRELLHFGAAIDDYVPQAVVAALEKEK